MRRFASRLRACGGARSTPAAFVHGASHPGSSSWIGDLASLGAASFETELPAVIVVGEVVSMASKLGQQSLDALVAR